MTARVERTVLNPGDLDGRANCNGFPLYMPDSHPWQLVQLTETGASTWFCLKCRRIERMQLVEDGGEAAA